MENRGGKLTDKLTSHFSLHYSHVALSGGDADSYCQESVKTFSHLSCHELSKARRERESGDEQGDEGGIHQASDGKGRAAGSLISVSVTLCAYLLVSRMVALFIDWACATQIIQLLYLISRRCICTVTRCTAVG